EVLTIEEDEVSDLTTSIDSIMGGGPESEFPSFETQNIDAGIACSLLPLRFLNFTALRYAELKYQLAWITADEINNSHFEVQRSNDGGKSFLKIGSITAYPDSREINHYQFIDHSAKPGQNYYRLKQIDLDGKFEYTPVRSVYFGNGSFNVEAYPNPVADVLYIQINDAEENGTIRLIDITGKEVLSMNSNAGSENIEVSVNALPPGAYTLLVNSGMNNYQQKIIITAN
ncbi:MAG TPA: T9SS type A sorting domain-containing protein, partial [Saprospiraceae bacterium]|nr:T9SS type A sorting domain-containing protein [Saprospiraceae bacterium]